MTRTILHIILTWLIAAVWIANGLFCKVLHLVPRHEQIVGRILGNEYAKPLVTIIGACEILMALWIVIGIRSRWNAIAQIIVVAGMNAIEFVLAPDLLLFGKMNSAFALLLIIVIYWNEFILNKTMKQPDPHVIIP